RRSSPKSDVVGLMGSGVCVGEEFPPRNTVAAAAAAATTPETTMAIFVHVGKRLGVTVSPSRSGRRSSDGGSGVGGAGLGGSEVGSTGLPVDRGGPLATSTSPGWGRGPDLPSRPMLRIAFM